MELRTIQHYKPSNRFSDINSCLQMLNLFWWRWEDGDDDDDDDEDLLHKSTENLICFENCDFTF